MAPAEAGSDAFSSRDLQLQELIFSCCVCQATIDEIYAAREHNKGFHSGSGDDDGVVTRLWIAECAHAFCGKHLDGGAAPFHPEGEQPIAPCPQCFRERSDGSPKRLFGIRGLTQGEHDPNIPSDWFRCPPVNLDGATPGMDAMRFQYMALARCAQKYHGRWLDAEMNRTSSEQSRTKERKYRKQLQADMEEMEAKVIESSAATERAEAQLKKWRDRQPIINHYLGMVKTMADDMALMRAQLTELGYAVPERDYSFDPTARDSTQSKPKSNILMRGQRTGASNSSSPTADRGERSSSSLGKRKRGNPVSDGRDHRFTETMMQQRTCSREMMPPPLLKPSRQEIQPEARECDQSPFAFSQPIYPGDPRETGPAHSHCTMPAQTFQNHRSQDWSRHAESRGSSQHASAEQQVYLGHDLGSHQPKHGLECFGLDSASQAGGHDVHRGGDLAQRNNATAQVLPQVQANRHTIAHRALDSANDGHTAAISVNQPNYHHGRQPLRKLSRLPVRPHQPRRYREPCEASHGRLVTPPPHKPPGPPVASPFFRINAPFVLPPATHASPTRESFASKRASIDPRRRQPEFRRHGTADGRAQGYSTLFRDRSHVNETIGDDPYHATSRIKGLPYRQLPTATTQTPRRQAIQASSSAHIATPSSHHLAASQPQAAAFRNRITLAPSAAPSQEMELSSIPGLRSGSPQQNDGPYMQRGRAFQDPRKLFSVAGRRSVRR